MTHSQGDPSKRSVASRDGLGDEEGSSAKSVVHGSRYVRLPETVSDTLIFRLEFGPAILALVIAQLNSLPRIPLADVTSASAPYPGFYQLFEDGESRYLGRTKRSIGGRLTQHRRKLRGKLPIDRISCKYLFVEDVSLVGISEDTLIDYFHPLGLDDWGKRGFGSNPTGFGRSRQRSKWTADQAPDLAFPVRAGHSRARTLAQHIRIVQRGAPLTLSVPDDFKERLQREFPEPIVMYMSERPFSEWVAELQRILGSGWKVKREPMAWYIVPSDA